MARRTLEFQQKARQAAVIRRFRSRPMPHIIAPPTSNVTLGCLEQQDSHRALLSDFRASRSRAARRFPHAARFAVHLDHVAFAEETAISRSISRRSADFKMPLAKEIAHSQESQTVWRSSSSPSVQHPEQGHDRAVPSLAAAKMTTLCPTDPTIRHRATPSVHPSNVPPSSRLGLITSSLLHLRYRSRLPRFPR
jgi:hypothetical protein